ncbi:Wzz/FepE/Etk N-terminal domain-containing protein [Actinomyces qiguomingii]|uniref:Wzz/FepE/Etk N-terminal domain-containing protein n=1 Tax=Actinomyces qiguomingii TaxID=2057800 RepID=UPI001304B81E|nr:Wzz/FepE/Etk N-terminal domain-containing protein [Actinomyces qiguomingii]
MTTDYIVRALRRHWRLIMALSVVGTLLGAVTAAVSPPVYRSSVTTLLTVASTDGADGAASDTKAVTGIAPTLVEFSEARSTLTTVAEATGVPADELPRRVAVANPSNTLLIVVTATGSSSAQAENIALAMVDALSDHAATLSVSNGAESTPLTLSDVDGSSAAQLIGPSKLRHGLIGAIGGSLLGLLLALTLQAPVPGARPAA